MNDTTKSAPSQGEPEMKGWLFKWTNYLKGYQRRWFVLSNGLLSYYRNQAEMAHTCRGTISLHGALIHTVDSCTFVISNGGTQTFHIKAASEVERQSWVTALELAKARAIRAMESEDDEETNGGGESSREDISTVLRELNARLEELQTCSDLLQKHGAALQRSLKELENLDDVQGRSKEINERATLFRIASNAMINRCSEYLEVAKTQGTKWHKMLQHEREQKLRLEEFVEQLARQHSHLEKAATQHAQQRPNNVGSEEEEEDNEFFDCVTDASNNPLSGMERKAGSNHSLVQMGNSTSKKNEDGTFIMKIPVSGNVGHESEESSSETEDIDHKKVVLVSTSSAMVTKQTEASGGADMESFTTHGGNVKKRRTRVPEKPNYPLSLWSIMKNCIGKDLSKIPMPVNFSEPLSMLQRLTEDFEYSDVLDIAAKCEDPYEQLAYVAAFTVSAYSTTSNRTGKPFNPLLGETYEFDRTSDLGWRIINEQVSHHPPMVAQYCEGREWKCWQEFTMTSKFRGKYIQIAPLGNANVLFTATNRRYTWQKVTTTVHNIIVGKLWVDQYGDTDIIGYDGAAGIKCHLKYLPYSYFTRDSQRRVKGCVMDPAGEVKYVINGTWDSKIEISKVTGTTNTGANKQEPIYQTGHTQTAWKRRPVAPDSDKYYNFTLLACQLNEPEDGVAPTDSRLRPDQRLMENGEWNKANDEKVRLEEKQRAKRREREQKAEIGVTQNGAAYESYTPLWFKKEEDPATGMIAHVYQHEYWDCKVRQDWSRCPDIF
ncbi:oxysterol-binding protein 1 [Chrysoperla carnea]|uniref:oxysterol-binding protein 1 n=1 Tax=Chrysoperla carnea TaxID=189513 RepID=UPI001D092A5F|nr:oxysterol-binding protein 1 [Chrysoperla carnea]